MQFLIKTIVSALLIASIATVSKRMPLFGAIIASLPITSILAMIWLYNDTKDIGKVIELSRSIFYIVIPSLAFFLSLPILLKKGMKFYLAIMCSSALMVVVYYLYIKVLSFFHIDI